MRKSAHEMTMECIAAARPGDESTDASFGRGPSTGSGQAGQWRREREQVPEHVQEQEIDAAREWLAHVEARRIWSDRRKRPRFCHRRRQGAGLRTADPE
jgi:hypothetical protein